MTESHTESESFEQVFEEEHGLLGRQILEFSQKAYIALTNEPPYMTSGKAVKKIINDLIAMEIAPEFLDSLGIFGKTKIPGIVHHRGPRPKRDNPYRIEGILKHNMRKFRDTPKHGRLGDIIMMPDGYERSKKLPGNEIYAPKVNPELLKPLYPKNVHLGGS